MCLEETILWGYLTILSNYKHTLFCFGVFSMFAFSSASVRNPIVFKMVLTKFVFISEKANNVLLSIL